MNDATRLHLQQVFDDYAARFRTNGSGLPPLMQLKYEHCRRTSDAAREIASELGWAEGRIALGASAGLFHDIGRFSQLAEFATLADRTSVDHGERGYEVIRSGSLLDACEAELAGAIQDSVRYHNRRLIPEGLTPLSLTMTQLVRDADKLDILDVLDDALRTRSYERHPEIFLNVDLEGPLSPTIVAQILEHRSASYEHLRSLADFKLVILTWVYNVNYWPALRRITRRGYMQHVRDTLPDRADVRAIIQDAESYVADRLRAAGA